MKNLTKLRLLEMFCSKQIVSIQKKMDKPNLYVINIDSYVGKSRRKPLPFIIEMEEI